MFRKIHLWSHLVQNICWLGFWVTTLISLVLIDLSRFSDSSWFNLEGYMFVGIYPFHPCCPICWHIVVCNIFLWSFVFLWYQLLLLHFHTVLVRGDAWCDFNLLKFIKTCFVFWCGLSRKCSMCPWKKCIFCYFGEKGSENINSIPLVQSVI